MPVHGKFVGHARCGMFRCGSSESRSSEEQHTGPFPQRVDFRAAFLLQRQQSGLGHATTGPESDFKGSFFLKAGYVHSNICRATAQSVRRVRLVESLAEGSVSGRRPVARQIMSQEDRPLQAMKRCRVSPSTKVPAPLRRKANHQRSIRPTATNVSIAGDRPLRSAADHGCIFGPSPFGLQWHIEQMEGDNTRQVSQTPCSGSSETTATKNLGC
jgi:hypothetical protein